MPSEQNSLEKPALWTRNFTTCAIVNFLLFFSFYQLLPILPLYIISYLTVIPKCIAGFVLVKSGKWIKTIVPDEV